MTRPYRECLWLQAALLGALCCFKLTEQDVFWQIRAGDDLWRTGTFATVDTWTYTVPGTPWHNFPWLSTLILRAIFGLGGPAALVLFRGLCVAGLCLGWGQIARTLGAGVGRTVTLVLLAWVAALPRLQLRPELFVLLCQMALMAIWVGPASLRKKSWGSVLLVLLAANLHPGLSFFVALCAVAFLLSNPTRMTFICAALSIVSLFLTPYGPRVLPFLWSHLTYFQQGVLPNPEHRRTNVAYFISSAGIAILCLCGLAVYGTLKADVPGVFRRRLPILVASLLLVGVSFERTRAWVFTCHLAIALAANAPHLRPRSRRLRVAGTLVLIGLVVVPVTQLAPAWGLSLDRRVSPVLAAQYLLEHRSQHRLFHNFTDATYLVWALRAQPLCVDTRETPFWSIEPQIQAAFASSDAMEIFVQRYGIDTILLPIPRDINDQLGHIFGVERWALSYFDATHVVLTRRLPGAVDPNDYIMLHPTLAANAYARSNDRTPARDRRFAQEIGRCLADDASNAWCLIAQGAFIRVGRGPGARQQALLSFSRARNHLDGDSPLNAVLAAELVALGVP